MRVLVASVAPEDPWGESGWSGTIITYAITYTVTYTFTYTFTYTVTYTFTYTVTYTVDYTVTYTINYTVTYTAMKSWGVLFRRRPRLRANKTRSRSPGLSTTPP